MNKHEISAFLSGLLLLLLCLPLTCYSQTESISNLFILNTILTQHTTIYDFDTEDQWKIGEYSKNLDVSSVKIQRFIKKSALMPDIPGLEHYYLSLQLSFTKPGYNFFDFVPATVSKNDGIIHKYIINIWGGGYKYYIEMHLKDVAGNSEIIKIADLNFLGWKTFEIEIPDNMFEQKTSTETKVKDKKGNIKIIKTYTPESVAFEKFRIWALPEGRCDDFIIMFDDMEIVLLK